MHHHEHLLAGGRVGGLLRQPRPYMPVQQDHARRFAVALNVARLCASDEWHRAGRVAQNRRLVEHFLGLLVARSRGTKYARIARM